MPSGHGTSSYGEASAAIAEFLEGYARVAALPESQGDSGFYFFMKGRVSSTLISYTELGRRAKTLYGLARIIQTEFFGAESQASWAGFEAAHKSVSSELLAELYSIWETSAHANAETMKKLYGEEWAADDSEAIDGI